MLFHFVILKAFYPLVLIVSYKVGVHLHLQLNGQVMDTLGQIIFIHCLRSTVLLSLSQSKKLPRYYR